MSKRKTTKAEMTGITQNSEPIDWSAVRAAQAPTITKLHRAWCRADARRHDLGDQLAWELAGHFPTEILALAADVAEQLDIDTYACGACSTANHSVVA